MTPTTTKPSSSSPGGPQTGGNRGRRPRPPFLLLAVGLLVLAGGLEFARADFSGAFIPANWALVNTNATGSVNTAGAPASISITSGNGGTGQGDTTYTRAAPSVGQVTFDWSFTTVDSGANFDPFGSVQNGSFVQLSNSGGATVQNGTASFPISTGQLMGFQARTTDNTGGASTTTITNFRFDPVVTSTADSGAGSLRQATLDATPGASITFDNSLNGQTITLTSGELSISKSLTIDASTLADGVTVSGNDASRIFNVTATGDLTLHHLALRSGMASAGGAVLNGNLFTANSCEFSNNHSTVHGGAIQIGGLGSVINLSNCTLDNNVADALGGAVMVFSGVVNIENSTFAGNSATNGTAIWAQGAVPSGVAITNSTISGNVASDGNGQAVVRAGTTAVITAENTIVAGNVTISSQTSGVSFTGTNIISGDPLLAPLANYGGPTKTMPPLSESPAIDPAGTTTSLPTDQRGFARVVGATVDIGAVEAGETVTVANATELNNAIQAATPDRRIIFDPTLDGQILVLNAEITHPAGSVLMIDGSSLPTGITLQAAPSSRLFQYRRQASRHSINSMSPEEIPPELVAESRTPAPPPS